MRLENILKRDLPSISLEDGLKKFKTYCCGGSMLNAFERYFPVLRLALQASFTFRDMVFFDLLFSD